MGRPRTPKGRANETFRRLIVEYPDAHCELDHRNPYELLAATILSAQCTDVRVNLVTPALFARFPSPESLADADQLEVEELVRSTGFYRNKARSLIGRLGLSTETDPVKLEHVLNDMIRPADRGTFSLLLILHGRRACPSRTPRCTDCVLNDFCPSSAV